MNYSIPNGLAVHKLREVSHLELKKKNFLMIYIKKSIIFIQKVFFAGCFIVYKEDEKTFIQY